MKKLSIGLICTLAIVLTACGNIVEQDQTENSTSTEITYTFQKFELDSRTIRNADETKVKLELSNENFDKSANEENNYTIPIGELTIENADTTQNFTIDGDDVIYKDITYTGLYKNTVDLPKPCDEITFINFILKNYAADGSERISTSSCIETDYYSDEADSVDYTIDEDFSDDDRYVELREKYGEPAIWKLFIYTASGKNRIEIYGCSSYMFLLNTNQDITVDMGKYNKIEEISIDPESEAVDETGKTEETEEEAVEADSDSVETDEVTEESTSGEVAQHE
jgi:hypothetical protein